MAVISVLRHEEGVRLDADRLVALYEELGEAGANTVVSRAMEELALRMAEMEGQIACRDLIPLARNARALGRVAGQVGMTGFARVAQDVADCATLDEHVQLAATWARLVRIGDRSLMAVWDLQDMSV